MASICEHHVSPVERFSEMTDEKKKSSRAATPPPKDRGCIFSEAREFQYQKVVSLEVVQYSMVQ